ncbi:glycosyltransferase family 4 protein [Patescibacteria group bacterium]|nr:glycosyltransferase family 4 protein [Patescibacteria group bacterium]MBU4458378.1 glycosyltransferase family 4 protein [Patescibacteria group bacterium]MCG2695867.1 glycosyltransferase family 4 protein [Candidatus Portnoybacteria bacterium]
MKLIYLTSNQFPSQMANSQQILNTSRGFYKLLNKDFLLIIANAFESLKGVNYKEVGFNKKGLRTFYYFFWTFKFFFKNINKKDYNIVYCRDSNLLLILSLLKNLFHYKIALEYHRFEKTSKEKFIIKHVDYFIVITNYFKDLLIKKFNVSKDKIIVVPDAVDLKAFEAIDISTQSIRHKLNLPLDKNLIGFIGRFKTKGQEKGIKTMIESLRFLDDLDISMCFVGGTEDEIEEYKTMADKYNFGHKCIFIKYQLTEMVPFYAKAMDILTMPFPWIEHYAYYISPMKMFEYMAAGKPIVASDLPSIREILNNNNAILIAPNNPKMLAEGIKTILNDSFLAEKILSRASEDVKKYTWDKRAERIIDFLKKDENIIN